jgi:indole-3-glycerol phosphate synthase
LILDRILIDKQIEVETRKAQIPLERLKQDALSADPPRDFKSALAGERIFHSQGDNSRKATSGIRLLAEVKKASPSKGLIRADFDPVKIAKIYETSGVSAISVLTDEKYFQGHADYLKAVRAAVQIPVLRKDFIVDPYQIYEARAWAADAILLIVAALSPTQISEYAALASDLGMAALVEVHTLGELDVALNSGADIIGVNNRNLQTFETTLKTSIELASRIPADRVLVSESGIFSRADVLRLMEAGVDAILVGESLMRETDPGIKVKELLGLG